MEDMKTENAVHYMLMVYLDRKPPLRRTGRNPTERHAGRESLTRGCLPAPSPTGGPCVRTVTDASSQAGHAA